MFLLQIDQDIFNIMLAKSMHQIARIEFRNAKFPYARGLCPLATPAKGVSSWTPDRGPASWKPRSRSTICPPLSSCWIRPWLWLIRQSDERIILVPLTLPWRTTCKSQTLKYVFSCLKCLLLSGKMKIYIFSFPVAIHLVKNWKVMI